MEDGALVRVVSALVENPAVQQHVLRLLDVQIDGIAANCQEMEVNEPSREACRREERENKRERERER
jgi:hypothetical protein